MSLESKKVLITGASGGIGSAIAKKCSEAGAIVGLSCRDTNKLSSLVSQLPNKAFTFACDLNNMNSVENLFIEAEDTMQGIDVLICNAGMTKDNLAIRMSNEDFEEVLRVNLESTFVLNRTAIKKMLKRKYGRIINIASVVGVMGNAGQANYVASKAGIIGMSKTLALEVASKNITVNCVAPGFITTAMTDVLTDEQKEKILSTIPMGKMGTANDVAEAVLFLADDKSSYITGQTIHVNGGMFRV